MLATVLFKQENSKRKIEDDERNEVVSVFGLYYGIGMKKEESEAKRICLKDSLKENLIIKGIKHYNGWEVEKDLSMSLKYFQEFVDKNEEKEGKQVEVGYCLNMIAYFHKEGKGVEKNVPKAIRLYEIAIELGNSMAMNNLAYLYKSGKGVKKNTTLAIQLYEKAIKLGNISSMYNLAYLYEQGDGIEKDMSRAIRLYERAIELGNSMAMNNLAMIFKSGKFVEKDVNKAINLYQRAIELGNKNSMYNLAYLFEDGKEVVRDIKKAILLYSKSSELGNSSAMNNLGMIYKKGIGVEKNITKAVELFQKATEIGNKNALINLAILHEETSEFEKSAHYFFKLFKVFDENENTFKKKLIQLVATTQIEWKTDYHQFWNASPQLESQILSILLISKHRRRSTRKESFFMVKGIAMIIIKFLCHQHQHIPQLK